MNPKILTAREKRLLEPVAPGFLTYSFYAFTASLTAGYGAYVWRGYGYMGFLGKPVIPFIGLYLFCKGSQYGVNYIREQLYTPERNQLVDQYRMRFGEQYLLDVLDPSFKLTE